MIKNLLKGIQIGIGFILVLGILFGIVYAVGFHSAGEILGGTFLGNYKFTGNVEYNGVLNATNAILIGNFGSGGVIDKTANLICNNTRNGTINYQENENESILKYCNGVKWTTLSISSKKYNNCKEIFDSGLSDGDKIYQIDHDDDVGTENLNVYCDMTNGGWTLVDDFGTNNQYGVDSLSSTGEIAAAGWTLSAGYSPTFQTDYFHDFALNAAVGSISKVLPEYGSRVKIKYRNAHASSGTVNLYINGVLKSSKSPNQIGTEEYDYNSGDVIKIDEVSYSIFGIYELWVK